MSNQELLLPIVGLAVLGLVMALAWRKQRLTGNAGIVDPLWSGSIGLLGLGYGLFADGWWPRRLLVATIVGLWSLRLTVHLVRRVSREAEDGRYATLRSELGPAFQGWMFWFYQAQGLLAVLLSLTVWTIASASRTGWSAWDLIAILLAAASLYGEALADRQLSAWRTDPANRGRTCRSGLWRFSRHPNYFFEWLFWFVYPLLAIGLPWGWALWAAPALMLFLVVKVTGIPPTEAQSVKHRGDDYRAYQRSTSAFFPWPPSAAEDEGQPSPSSTTPS